jgi:hypothetical protein
MNIGKLDNLALEKVALEVTLNVPSALNRREASTVAKKQAKTKIRFIWKELKNKKLKHLEILFLWIKQTTTTMSDESEMKLKAKKFLQTMEMLLILGSYLTDHD